MTSEIQKDSLLNSQDIAELEKLRAKNNVNRELAIRAVSKLVLTPDGILVDQASVDRELAAGRSIEGVYAGGHR